MEISSISVIKMYSHKMDSILVTSKLIADFVGGDSSVQNVGSLRTNYDKLNPTHTHRTLGVFCTGLMIWNFKMQIQAYNYELKY